LTHWTGARSRLDRDLSGRFGSASYAREELIADIASSFVNSELGLPTDIENHANYLSSWLDMLKNDRREIFRAAAAAQKAADYCLAFHPDFATKEAVSEAENADESASLAAA
jgi:antirestriction protein ArdC